MPGILDILGLWDPYSGPVAATLVEVDIREALYAQLAADATLAALVGSNIYPIEIPEGGTTPAITYKVISDVHYLDLDGPNDTARARVQLAAISEDYDQCLPVVRRLRRIFHGFSGDMHGVTVTSAYQDAAFGAKDSAQPMRDGSGTLRYLLIDDFRIHYRTPPG